MFHKLTFDQVFSFENVSSILSSVGYTPEEINEIYSHHLDEEYNIDLVGYVMNGRKYSKYTRDSFSSLRWKKLVDISAPEAILVHEVFLATWLDNHILNRFIYNSRFAISDLRQKYMDWRIDRMRR